MAETQQQQQQQNKSASQTPSDQPQHPQAIYGIQPPAGAPYPTVGVGAYPQYYPYPHPPADGNSAQQDHGVPNPAPPGTYMMAFPPPPPGMIYAYPTAQGYPAMPFPAGLPLPAALVRPKRKQVKMACTNCAAACKRCDEGRPCERCCKYGISDSCQDGVRKERKKGIKRGPYKRKGKVNPDQAYEGFPQDQNPGGEAFYPSYFYPPPFIPIGPDGQPLQLDPNAVAHAQSQGQPGPGPAPGMAPHPQFYPIHPAAYPPYAAYPHAHAHAHAGAYPVVSAGHVMPAAAVQPVQGTPPSTHSAGGEAGNDAGKAPGSGSGQKEGQDGAEGNGGAASPQVRGKRKGKTAAGKEDGASGTTTKKTKKASAQAGTGGQETNGNAANGSAPGNL